MAGTVNPGDAIAALDTILAADMGVKLDALDTEYSATGNEVLLDISKVWLAPQERYQEVPAIALIATDITRLEDIGHNIYEINIVTEVIWRSNDATAALSSGELVIQQLQRYVRAVHEVVLAKRTLHDGSQVNADFVYLDRADYGPLRLPSLEKRAEMDFRIRVSI